MEIRIVRLLEGANNRGKLVIRSLIMLAIALTVCVVVYLVYKITLVHLEVQNFTRQVELIQKQVEVSSMVELSRVLIILDEISSDVPSGPIKDQAQSLKREVLALINKMGGSKSLGTEISEERDVKLQEPENMDPNFPISPDEESQGLREHNEPADSSERLEPVIEEYSVESE